MIEKVKAWWAAIQLPSARYSVLVLVGGGFVAGIVVLAGLLGEMQATASEKFCISCHEMADNVYAEYRLTPHFSNGSGVRAICSDCHLAKDFLPKAARKTAAVRELFHKMIGTIDSREKFENHRLAMAKRVWQEMKDNDSRECRSCHDAKAMDYTKQSRRAMQQHIKADDERLTCIECHKGVAHQLPVMEEIDPSAVIGGT